MSDDTPNFKIGQVWEANGQRFIILKAGRGLVVSIVVQFEGQRGYSLMSEATYWRDHRGWQLVSHKPANTKWARDYGKTHALPQV